jgi:uncharacterized protein YecE (DUF72 family)
MTHALTRFAALPPYIGCAGWSLPIALQPRFPKAGTHLTRYAARFNAVEINSSFYRPHRRGTYVKWAESVPENFRFCVKMPKTITHEHRLLAVGKLLRVFLDEVSGLGGKLGCLLIQLPPSFSYQGRIAGRFFPFFRKTHP